MRSVLQSTAVKKMVRVLNAGMQCVTEEIVVCDPESHLEIRVEEGARGQVVVRLEDAVAAHSLELILGEQSALEVTTLCDFRSPSEIQVQQHAIVGPHAKLHVCNATFGGNVEHALTSHVTGIHSESSIDWVFSGKGEDRLHLSVKNLFDAPEGKGEITVKGVVEGKANCKCDGMIEITERGSRTDTYLTETMLMLDATARCDAVPALEIKTNDVKASHSATVTKVSEEDLFYFRTRGIGLGQARRMFIEGFLRELLQRFPQGARRALTLCLD